MGTSMSYSQQDRNKMQFRNSAIPLSKIQPHEHKFYKYRSDLPPKVHSSNIRNKRNSVEKGREQKQEQGQGQLEQTEGFVDMPHDIPSIEEHSELAHPRVHAIRESQPEEESSSVEEYGGMGKYVHNSDGVSFAVKQKQKQNTRTQPINRVTYPPEHPREQSISQLPNHSHINGHSQSPSRPSHPSSNKKSSGRPESESNHALSEIILQREAYCTINYEGLKDDINEEEQNTQEMGAGGAKEKVDEVGKLGEGKMEVVSGQCQEAKEQKTRMGQQQTVISMADKASKAKPFNIILQLNSNIRELSTKASQPTFAKNIPTSYSNCASLPSTGRPRKLLYF